NQPDFQFLALRGARQDTRVALFINRGRDARAVSIQEIDPMSVVGISPACDFRMVVKGEEYEVVLASPDGEGRFSIQYTDVLGVQGEAIVQRSRPSSFRVLRHCRRASAGEAD